MTVEEFYNQIGGSADNILERLSEISFIKKFIIQFLNDPTFSMLKEDIENKNFDKANFDAHSLKGVCAVLDFVKLKELTEELVLCLKQNKSYLKIWKMLENEYYFIVSTIKSANWQDC